MFKKSNRTHQGNLFNTVSSLLEGKARTLYCMEKSWHNQFFQRIVSRIEEADFEVLFDNANGAPNASIRILISMMILKEGFGWSDSEMYENARFNLLARKALGVHDVNENIPTESTYYLLRKRIYIHKAQTGNDLLAKVFDTITQSQLLEFEVSGKSIRMDSKLIGSNIAYFSRYEIIQTTFVSFCKTMTGSNLKQFTKQERLQVSDFLKEEPLKTVYHSTKADILTRLDALGTLICNTLHRFKWQSIPEHQLLQRVFDEQYMVDAQGVVALRPNDQISSGSVQSPHDPDATYRKKGDQKVKGYSVNVTETLDDDQLHLITSVIVEPSNVSDTVFVQPSVADTEALTGSEVEKIYLDGGYQTPDNEVVCKGKDMIYTGIQGVPSRFELEMVGQTLYATDTQTGERIEAIPAKRLKTSKEKKWFILFEEKKIYFTERSIRASKIRKEMTSRPIEESQRRNNVESTINHLGCLLRNKKVKYRRIIKVEMWAVCRCLWINLLRIINFEPQVCPDGTPASQNSLLSSLYGSISRLKERICTICGLVSQKLAWN